MKELPEPAPIERLWRLITDVTQMGRWSPSAEGALGSTAVAGLAGWLGLDGPGRRALGSLQLPPVMADPTTPERAERLGYAPDPATWR